MIAFLVRGWHVPWTCITMNCLCNSVSEPKSSISVVVLRSRDHHAVSCILFGKLGVLFGAKVGKSIEVEHLLARACLRHDCPCPIVVWWSEWKVWELRFLWEQKQVPWSACVQDAECQSMLKVGIVLAYSCLKQIDKCHSMTKARNVLVYSCLKQIDKCQNMTKVRIDLVYSCLKQIDKCHSLVK